MDDLLTDFITETRETLEAMAARQPGAPLSMVGAGVEDPEHAAAGSGQAISEELDRWVPLLRRFAHVSVRGPRSQRLLADRGVSAWIAGDVAAAGVHGPGGSVTLDGAHA